VIRVGLRRARERGRRGDRLGKVREKHRNEQRGAHRAGLEHRETEDERLGDPVENDPEHDRATGLRHALVLGAPGRTAADDAFDRLLGAEEHERAAEQAERDAAVSGRRLERLVHELVGDRAQQDARAEGHHQPDDPPGQRHTERDGSTDDERRAGNRAPQERFAHARGTLSRGGRPRARG
jgi:hypothetical protein